MDTHQFFDCIKLGKELGKGISTMFADPKPLNIIADDKKGFVLLDVLPHKVRRRNLFKAKKMLKE